MGIGLRGWRIDMWPLMTKLGGLQAGFRNRKVAMPDERATSAERVIALETALTGFAERKTDTVVTPSVGLTFDSIIEAYDFYNLYSWETGFGIRYAKSRTNVKGTRCMQEFVCCCSGKPKEPNSTSSRCQCQAMIRLLRTDDDGWYINEFRSSHNHQMLNTCAEKLHFPSHRHIDKYTRELVSQLRENNVNLSKVYSTLATFFGRVENVPFTKRCLRTLCGKLSREQADDDVRKTMAIFSEMKVQDSEFSYNVQVDDESRIRTLMWTNGRSKKQYHHFGDVVTFDTTYKTNLYDMPFGIFVGVNNHFQSVLYAGVLMRDETVDTFKWIFDEFVKMMGGKRPITILTDQARAMEVAIEDVYPDATQRWCKWHILKKAKESLGSNYTKKSDFRAEFHKLVHEMLTIEEFEDRWAALLEKYSLTKNTHLTQIYETRQKWAKPYFAGKFCARQTSTGRSESANHMLKQYVPPSCSMNLFVKQYNKLQFDREQEEGFQEKRTRLSGAVLKVNTPLEMHASKVYTRKMFEIFGGILYESGSYDVEEIIPKQKYIVTHVKAEKREKWFKCRYEVNVSDNLGYFSCICGLFEHMGMVCCHSLQVMNVLRLKEIPPRHILKRWSIHGRDNLPDHLKHYQQDMGPPDAPTYRHSALYITALEVVKMGDRNLESYKFMLDGLVDLRERGAKISAPNDGLGIAEQQVSNTGVAGGSNGKTKSCKAACSVRSVEGNHLSAGGATSVSVHPPASQGEGRTKSQDMASEGSCPNANSYNSDYSETASRLDVNVGDSMLAPEREKKRGRPTTSRDKAPYEKGSNKRSRFCSICRGKGHKSSTCPDRGDAPKKERKVGTCSKCGLPKKERKVGTCSKCGLPGHRKTTCSKPLVSSMPGVPPAHSFPGTFV
ncbi:protein FAR1-RELATED SEQUENCE 5 isoform X4 [Aegilops tauschii subsp. strangulata]|uniref:SWIM-type domain-containing protein n=1 Tax=Aegilops tauschii subsp. strangulata TaxID=200361 RepID=A0A453CHX7_AEGTS|nr:protein FAR1-RELATED SEQUENCE 7 isoform X4 [Aegilops tauschii subsp. strangulata]